MKRSARALTSLLFLTVLAALAVPAGFHLAPAVEQFIRPPAQQDVLVPPYQLPPEELSTFTAVRDLETTAPTPDARILGPQLRRALTLAGPGQFTAVVQDAVTGDVLYDQNSDDAVAPASNVKLLTAAAALSVLGADHRFSTSVVQGRMANNLILRGGGDVLLASGASRQDAVRGNAGLQTLAERTVAALVEKGVTGSVTVMVDDSLFAGTALNPAWEQGDIDNGEIAPVFPLALNSAWLDEEKQEGPRVQDAALAAGEAFKAALQKAGADAGIMVKGQVQRGRAPADANTYAVVSSATVARQVEEMLLSSDNYLAEALARMTAFGAGKAPSFGGATEAVREAVERLGVSTQAMMLADASGLSARNRVSATQLAETTRLMAVGDVPEIREGLAGFPVAGLSGTLGDRYREGAPAEAAGLVRAKTGTLNAVSSLTGYVVDADGRLLVFSFVATGLEGNVAQARAAADGAAAVLARCGC